MWATSTGAISMAPSCFLSQSRLWVDSRKWRQRRLYLEEIWVGKEELWMGEVWGQLKISLLVVWERLQSFFWSIYWACSESGAVPGTGDTMVKQTDMSFIRFPPSMYIYAQGIRERVKIQAANEWEWGLRCCRQLSCGQEGFVIQQNRKVLGYSTYGCWKSPIERGRRFREFGSKRSNILYGRGGARDWGDDL